MSNSLSLANFIYLRIKQTIANKQYIKCVTIGYNYEENYGNEYVSFFYKLGVSDDYFTIPSLNEREAMFESSSNYTFTLSTNKNQNKYSGKTKLLLLLEFRNIYESLTANAILQLEDGLNPDTVIKVRDISKWPEANYAAKYLLKGIQNGQGFMFSNFETDIRQWRLLHKLARETRKVYVLERANFSITDNLLHHLFMINVTDIRFLLLRHEIPIYFDGLHTIDKVHIHTPTFVEALKKELADSGFWPLAESIILKLISYLYDHFLKAQKLGIIKQQQVAFLADLQIQRNDIVELADQRLVRTNAIFLDENQTLHMEYSILKRNLETSERTRTVNIDQVKYVLKEKEFLQYLENNSILHLSLLQRWAEKRKVPVEIFEFRLNLLMMND